jgi:Ca2+-binding EF-hand superfamily protein
MKKLALMVTAMAMLATAPAMARPGGGERSNPDANGDGVVTRAEAEADIAKRFARMDMNKDGKLDAADREAMRKAREAKRAERGGRGGKMMERLDANGDGAVSLDEMKRGALARFDRADANKDGKLTGDEREAARPKRMRGDGGPPPPPAG